MNTTYGLRPSLTSFSRYSLIALFLLGAANASAASLVYTLDLNGCSGGNGCGTPPYGTVTLTEVDSDTVGVTVDLVPGVRFAGTGAGGAIGFNVAGTITIADVTSGFVAKNGSNNFSTFGTFAHWIDCTACQGGQADNPTGPLSFTVTRTGGLALNNFVANDGGYFFASDIVGLNGKTGNVGSNTLPSSDETVPEPFSAGLAASGLAGAALLRRRLKKAA